MRQGRVSRKGKKEMALIKYLLGTAPLLPRPLTDTSMHAPTRKRSRANVGTFCVPGTAAADPSQCSLQNRATSTPRGANLASNGKACHDSVRNNPRFPMRFADIPSHQANQPHLSQSSHHYFLCTLSAFHRFIEIAAMTAYVILLEAHGSDTRRDVG